MVWSGCCGGLYGGHDLPCILTLVQPSMPQGCLHTHSGIRGHMLGTIAMQGEQGLLEWRRGVRGQTCLHSCGWLEQSLRVGGHVDLDLCLNQNDSKTRPRPTCNQKSVLLHKASCYGLYIPAVLLLPVFALSPLPPPPSLPTPLAAESACWPVAVCDS